MTAPVPTGRRPKPALEPASKGSNVTSAIGLSENEGQAARGGLVPPAGAPGGGSNVRREFARYVVVGGISFVCDTGTLYSLTQFLKVHYLVSAPIGFVVGTVVNYALSRTWVFQRRTLKSMPAEMTIFTLIGVVGLGLNELILWFFQAKLRIYYLFAKGVSGGVVLIWNFGARKLALFS